MNSRLGSDRETRPVLITGAPAVGKSTVAGALARRLPLSAHIEADVLHRMIKNGGEWPSAGTEAAHSQLVLRTRNSAILAASFQRAGIRPVMDEVVAHPDQLRELSRLLEFDSVIVIALTAPDQMIRARDAGREKHTAAHYVGLEASIRTTLGGIAQWIDTTNLSPEETVETAYQLIEASGALDDVRRAASAKTRSVKPG